MRPDLEDDFAYGDVFVGEFAESDYAAKSEIWIGVETPQAVIGHDTVLAYDRHKVGCDRDGHKVEHRLKLVVDAQTVALGEGLHELETHSAAAQMCAWVGGVGHFRIEYRHGRRKGLVGHMVVADNEVDPFGPCIGYLLNSLYAAVEHDYQTHVVLCRIVDAFHRDSVALVIACRYVVFYIRVVVLKVFVDKCDSRGAVYIVVAIDHDAFLGAHSTVEPGYGLVHVGHKKRIVEVVERRGEERVGTFGCRYASPHEQLGDGGYAAAPWCHPVSLFLLLQGQGLIIPFLCHNCLIQTFN